MAEDEPPTRLSLVRPLLPLLVAAAAGAILVTLAGGPQAMLARFAGERDSLERKALSSKPWGACQ